MAEQTLCLDTVYQRRIDEVAKGHADAVLTARNTSGKTLTLFVSVPGLWWTKKAVVRLPKRLHKTFWKIVKAATEWLEAFKALYAPPVVALAAEPSTADLLAKAVAAIPEKAAVAAASVPKTEKPYYYRGGKLTATSVAQQYFSGNNIYRQSLANEWNKFLMEQSNL